MSPSPQLAPPGSSSYNSHTMHVGDGTWDAGRDDFLLPNLVGLNFATMRYNGMGNRFLTLNGYQGLVKAHGILAAITFLGLIPASIFLLRYLGRSPWWARRFHIWLNILALLLTTVLFILGFTAVGPKRSLSNPHHGIGVAIYASLWFEMLNGCLLHRHYKKRGHISISIFGMLHSWLGRAIALLGIAQIALGLTLYGSPAFLFILYALWVFALVTLYFILEYIAERRIDRYGSEGSYLSDSVVEGSQHRRGGAGKWLAAGAAGAGLAALWRRRSSHNRTRPEVVGSASSATSYASYEKHPAAHDQGRVHRLPHVGAIAVGIAAVKRLFGRKDHDDTSDVGPYRPPLGGNQSYTTSESVSRVEEGRPSVRPTTPTGASPGYARPSHPLAQPPMTPGGGTPGRNSDDSYSYYSYMSGSPSRNRRHHTFRDALAAGGAAYAVRSLFRNRKAKKEERRTEELRNQRLEQEKIARMNSAHRYTGDGIGPPRRQRHDRIGSQSASDMSSILEEGGAPVPGTAGAAAASALADRDRIRPVGTDPVIAPPGPSSALPADVSPAAPVHRPDLDSSGSEAYTTSSGRQRHRHRNEAPAGLAGAAAGALGGEAARRRRSGQHTDSVESPPVSVKVKMHNDGRHVTLRRLTEEEQAAQRRRDRRASGSRRRRNSSFSSSDGGEALAGGPAADRRWRRTEAPEAQQAAATNAPAQVTYPSPPPPGTQAIDPRTGHSYNVPAPPPIPGSSSNLGPPGSITSPGTETSGATEYANNRRRRRAERAQARLAREGRTGGGNAVEFT